MNVELTGHESDKNYIKHDIDLWIGSEKNWSDGIGYQCHEYHISGFVQDCDISIANALEIPQFWLI